jgi:hypothetical protein
MRDACVATQGQSEDTTWAIDHLCQHLSTDRSWLQHDRYQSDQTIDSATDRPTTTWRKADGRHRLALKSILCSSFYSSRFLWNAQSKWKSGARDDK